MRLFIAIKLNDEMLRSIEDIQNSLSRQGVRGNFTKTENLHLTLAFIGEYADPDYVLDTMQKVPFRPFELALEGFGNFGDLWWAGIKRSDVLSSYVKSLRHALADADIPFDRKKFSPHITLVRKASFVIRPKITIPGTSMTASHVSLFRSDRGKGGMIYTELGSVS